MGLLNYRALDFLSCVYGKFDKLIKFFNSCSGPYKLIFSRENAFLLDQKSNNYWQILLSYTSYVSNYRSFNFFSPSLTTRPIKKIVQNIVSFVVAYFIKSNISSSRIT